MTTRDERGLPEDMDDDRGDRDEYLTMTLDDQMFAVPVAFVDDVLDDFPVSPIPLAPPEVTGALNMRGHIVTVIDLRRRMGLDPYDGEEPQMGVVTETDGEFHCFLVDAVGDVLELPTGEFEKTPATLDPSWRSVSSGIFRLADRLLVILDVAALLGTLDEVDDAA